MNGKTLKQIRLSLFLTQEQMAEKLGVFVTTYQRWEWGVNVISLRNQRKIVQFCKENNIDLNKFEKN